MSHQTNTPKQPKQSPTLFIAFTAVAALTAALAAGSSLAFGLPVWAMFIGWVAFFSRGPSGRDGLINLGCVWLGVGFGIAAALGLGLLGPSLGTLALPLAVFVVAMIVVSLRGVPLMNNILGYFLGLIAFFAAHLEPALESFVHLASASSLGSVGAWISLTLQRRLPRFA